jgi:uncharacterized metal-binding protein
MPDGKTHAAMTSAAAASLYAAGYLVGMPTAELLALTGGCMAGLVLTPDLDVMIRSMVTIWYSERPGDCQPWC